MLIPRHLARLHKNLDCKVSMSLEKRELTVPMEALSVAAWGVPNLPKASVKFSSAASRCR